MAQEAPKNNALPQNHYEMQPLNPNQQMMYQQQQQQLPPGYNMPVQQAMTPQQMQMMQQQQMNMMMVPGNNMMMMPKASMQQILENISPYGVFIKQQIDWLEVVSGCEGKNRYHIYARNADGSKKFGPRLFKAKESTGCYERQCYPQGCRSTDMKVKNEYGDSGEQVLFLSKPFQCTCYCCNRPKMEVFHTEKGQNALLGSVIDPWDLCKVRFNVFNEKNEQQYTLTTPMCQLALCCQAPCESCQTVQFELHKGDKYDGQPVSHLTKKSKGCLKAMISDSDNFDLVFPVGATWQQKALLIATTLFIDYRMFEESEGKQSHHDY